MERKKASQMISHAVDHVQHGSSIVLNENGRTNDFSNGSTTRLRDNMVAKAVVLPKDVILHYFCQAKFPGIKQKNIVQHAARLAFRASVFLILSIGCSIF